MTGGFFIIDSRVFGDVCQLGMNPACAYLTLARGTQGDNRHTCWSVEAVRRFTGISVERSQEAVQSLSDASFIERIKSGTKPQYVIRRWHEMQNLRARRALEAHGMSPSERRVYDAIAQCTQPLTYQEQEIADKLLAHGLLHRDGPIYLPVYLTDWVEPLEETNQNLIWLPNKLVRGSNQDQQGLLEPSPVARVRRSGDVMALRLLVDLYQDQNLRDDGGISRRVLMQEFRRDQVGKVPKSNVFAFSPAGQVVLNLGAASFHFDGEDGSAFFARLSILQSCGLIDFVPHLCESADPESEIIHPCGLDWTEGGLVDLENEVGLEANEAGRLMADPTKWIEAASGGATLILPVSKEYPQAHIVGIARMRYRPRTRRTLIWIEEKEARLPAYIEQYKELRRTAERRRAREVARAQETEVDRK